MESQEDLQSVLSDETEPEASGQEETAKENKTALDGATEAKPCLVC